MEHRTNVLLVEDNPAEAGLIEEMFLDHGTGKFTLSHAGELETALECLERDVFDVVLLDLNLPDSMGLETLDRLQSRHRDLPVVVLTGMADEETAVRALHTGAQEYLVKGDVIDEGKVLIRTIRYAIERSRARNELRLKNTLLESSTMAFRNVVEHNRDGILVVDCGGMVRYANPRVADIFGWKQVRDGFYFGYPMAEGECAELDVVKPDRSTVVVEMSVADTEWEGQPAFVASLRDITEHKATAERLRLARDAAERASRENAHARKYLQDIVNALQHPFYVVDVTNYRVTMANAYVMANHQGTTCHELTHQSAVPCDQIDHVCPLAEVVRTGQPAVAEHLHYDDHGQPRDYEVHGMPMFDECNKVTHIVEYSLDITARKRLEDEIRLAGTVLDNATEAVMVTDSTNRIVMVNPAFTSITGYSMEEVLGKTPNILHSGRHDRAFYAAMWKGLLTEGKWEGEIWNRRKNGDLYPEWLSIATIRDQKQDVVKFAAIFTDITKRKADEEQLRFLANHDPLTQLPNRVLFHSRLEWSVARSRRDRSSMALLYIDLDRFKWVNDTLGHVAGDLLLQEAARRLFSCVRESDTVGRLGGDEFAVILADLRECADAGKVARHMLQELARPFDLDGRQASISGSIGIAFFPDDAQEIDLLIQKADAAMYYAKQAGKNTFHFHGSAS
ncbi:MAG: diguanylate cyclase [Magnetococcales bacterium]|nr:diguanylate cyclase [Magnetococcales bacterium]